MTPRRRGPSAAGLRVLRMALLTVVNAMLFQEVLSQSEQGVKTLRQTLAEPDPVGEFDKQWDYISKEIDFAPIFKIARQILLRLPAAPETQASLNRLAQSAIEISTSRAALRHDLMGRIYHRLLADPKFLGAFYTKIAPATMLLK